jgi:hypothetical protein
LVCAVATPARLQSVLSAYAGRLLRDMEDVERGINSIERLTVEDVVGPHLHPLRHR